MTQSVDATVLIALADGVDVEQGRAAVETVVARMGGADVMTRDEFVDDVAGQVDQMLGLIYVMLFREASPRNPAAGKKRARRPRASLRGGGRAPRGSEGTRGGCEANRVPTTVMASVEFTTARIQRLRSLRLATVYMAMSGDKKIGPPE